MAILANCTGENPYPALYQKFKEDVISKFNTNMPWTLTGEEVNKWLEQHKPKGEKDNETIKKF